MDLRRTYLEVKMRPMRLEYISRKDRREEKQADVKEKN